MTKTVYGVRINLSTRQLDEVCKADRAARWALKREQAADTSRFHAPGLLLRA